MEVKSLDLSTINELSDHILNKPELRSLDQKIAAEKLQKILNSNNKIQKQFIGKTSKEIIKIKVFKECEKSIRKELRDIYGMFADTKSFDKKMLLLTKFINKPNSTNLNALLQMHKSTKERINEYSDVYKKIFSITGIPTTILDLGCGFNPLAYSFLNCEPEYLASDISEQDCKFIQSFFDKQGIMGHAFSFDLTKYKKMQDIKLISCEVCFMFKLADVLESQKTGLSKKIITTLPAKWFVVSFASKTLGGKKEIPKSKRKWFENFMTHESITWKEIETRNEIFYVFKGNYE